MHHVVPKSIGGTNNPGNLVVLCCSCHGKVHKSSSVDVGRLTKKALAKRKSLGLVYSGSIPYGLRLNNGKLLLDKREIKLINFVQKLRKAGLSLRQIGAALVANKVPTKKGGKNWNTHVVDTIAKIDIVKLIKKYGP